MVWNALLSCMRSDVRIHLSHLWAYDVHRKRNGDLERTFRAEEADDNRHQPASCLDTMPGDALLSFMRSYVRMHLSHLRAFDERRKRNSDV